MLRCVAFDDKRKQDVNNEERIAIRIRLRRPKSWHVLPRIIRSKLTAIRDSMFLRLLQEFLGKFARPLFARFLLNVPNHSGLTVTRRIVSAGERSKPFLANVSANCLASPKRFRFEA